MFTFLKNQVTALSNDVKQMESLWERAHEKEEKKRKEKIPMER